jgi:RNA polymerase sigma factor (sigma-70 family)
MFEMNKHLAGHFEVTGPARRQAATIRVESGVDGLPGNEGHFSSATSGGRRRASRRAMRDEAVVDINQLTPSLVATTDPTASRQLHELDRALACLREEQREAILLLGFEGMSYEAAAQILSVPVGTVRSRLSRGRDALRRLMDMPEKANQDRLAQAA